MQQLAAEIELGVALEHALRDLSEAVLSEIIEGVLQAEISKFQVQRQMRLSQNQARGVGLCGGARGVATIFMARGFKEFTQFEF